MDAMLAVQKLIKGNPALVMGVERIDEMVTLYVRLVRATTTDSKYWQDERRKSPEYNPEHENLIHDLWKTFLAPRLAWPAGKYQSLLSAFGCDLPGIAELVSATLPQESELMYKLADAIEQFFSWEEDVRAWTQLK